MEGNTSILVEGTGELVDGGRDLQALLEDGTLALETDIEGPLDIAGQVTLGLDIIANGKVARTLLEERVSNLLSGSLSLSGEGSSSNLLGGLQYTR